MSYSQEFLEMKLEAIRESMNRAPAAIEPAKIKAAKPVKAKPVDEAKGKVIKKTVKAKVIKPNNNIKNDDFEPTDFKTSSRQEKVFKTIPLNLEEKIKIQIDARTWVYANPGADIEAIKAKYAAKNKL